MLKINKIIFQILFVITYKATSHRPLIIQFGKQPSSTSNYWDLMHVSINERCFCVLLLAGKGIQQKYERPPSIYASFALIFS